MGYRDAGRAPGVRSCTSAGFGEINYSQSTEAGETRVTNSVASRAGAFDQTLERAINELERSGALAIELAEFRVIQTNYGGATARLAAETLICMWLELEQHRI